MEVYWGGNENEKTYYLIQYAVSTKTDQNKKLLIGHLLIKCGIYIQSALRITPTAMPSILKGCVAKSTLMGENSWFSA